VFVELSAGLEVVRGGVEVVVLDGEQAESHVHVGCAAQAGAVGGVPERRLEGVLRVA
jgi:hypothetical protein